tara:strand:+ start:270 stop:611 length:342 start_codon:yes stop_codon:yes gene_type:complete
MTKNKENVAIQFIKGKDELAIPEIRLFRNIDGKKGYVIYKFREPKTITIDNLDSIQKMHLIDKEGEISTRKIDVSISEDNIKEVNSTYNWKSENEFDRFMRFAKRYANSVSYQ